MRYNLVYFLFGLIFLFIPFAVVAQTPATDSLAADSVSAGPDSLVVAAPKGSIETTIKYSARDSIRLDNETKIVYLYGDARIDYGTMSLTGDIIEINWETNTLIATHSTDTAGKAIGIPVFKDAAETYTAKRIAYNFKTKRGRISEAVTQQGEGFIHAEVVKKEEDNTLYGRNARYTTCSLEEPHFWISFHKMKVIPGDRVMAKPFNLVVGGVPTPLGFPFGLFPMPKKRSSGVIIPTYGESRDRGFFLRQGGYYFAVSDYLGVRLTGDVYSFGGWGANLENTYRKRYAYDGRLALRYNTRPADDFEGTSFSTNDPRNPRRTKQQDIWVEWYHNPVERRGGRLSANVNAGSSTFNRRNSFDVQRQLAPQFNSTISYQKVIQNTPFSYTATLRQSQESSFYDTIPGRMTFVLPDLNFTMSRQSPFQLLKLTPRGRWYENITVGYNLNFRNQFTNQLPAASVNGVQLLDGRTQPTTLPLNADNLRTIFKNGQIGAQHQIPITLSSFKLFNYFTLTPGVNYQETWFFRRLTYRYDPDRDGVVADTASGLFRAYNYAANASLSTRVYGMYNIKGKKIEAIRHVITPSFTYSYSPNYESSSFGYNQNVQIDPTGRFRRLSNYPNDAFFPPSGGRQSLLSFGLENNLEMKVKSKKDTVTGFEKVRLIDRLAVRSAYNFAADSFAFSPLVLDMYTTIFQAFTVSANTTFDLYQFDETLRRRVNVLELERGRLGRLQNANLALGADLNPATWRARRERDIPPPTNSPDLIPDPNPNDYIDFNIPWSMNVQYQASFFRNDFGPNSVTQSLSFSGDVSLTDNWKIGYRSGYDLENNEISYTSLDVYRDLHCWEMRLSWIPFGTYQSYSVNINAKASILQDLKLMRNRTWYDR